MTTPDARIAAQASGKEVKIEILADLWKWVEDGYVRRMPNGAIQFIVSVPADRLVYPPR